MLSASADLAVFKTGSPSVTAGQIATYTISVQNLTSGTAAQNVVLSDSVPAGAFLISEQPITNPDGFVDNTIPGSNAPNFSTTSMAGLSTDVFQVVVGTLSSLPDGTQLNDQASVISATPDPNTSNNFATFTSNVVTAADLSITKTGPTTLCAGMDATYTITLTNFGPSDSQGVSLNDNLPPGLTPVSQNQVSGPDAFTGGADGNTVFFTAHTMTAGNTDVFQIVALVTPQVIGTNVSNTATVAASTFDPNTQNNSSTSTAPAILCTVDVGVNKTGPTTIHRGDTVTYAITVSNSGNSNAASVVLTDALPSGLNRVSERQVSGNDSFGDTSSNNTASFTTPVLPGGHSDIFQVVARASNSLSFGTLTNTATVSTTSAETTTSNNTSSFSSTVPSTASLEFFAIENNGVALLGIFDTTNNRFVEASLGFFPNLTAPFFFTIPITQNVPKSSGSNGQVLTSAAPFVPGFNQPLSNATSGSVQFANNGVGSGTVQVGVNGVPLQVTFTASPGKEVINGQAMNLFFSLLASVTITALPNNGNIVSFSFFSRNGTQTTSIASTGAFVQVI
jgi:uncharacterized repeat protein (TIGR01451 family)